MHAYSRSESDSPTVAGCSSNSLSSTSAVPGHAPLVLMRRCMARRSSPASASRCAACAASSGPSSFLPPSAFVMHEGIDLTFCI
jgi:hypothetical protein